MCGIVGYVGTQRAAPVLLEGLKRLEYRGYDSAGVAVHDGERIEVVRTLGKLQNLAAALEGKTITGKTGLGHTRWATHGRPSQANAHPHVVGEVAVVHNGIIENQLELRTLLAAEGARFESDTDTEIVAHLIDRALKSGAPTLFSAVREALGRVRGAYALAVISRREPSRIVVAKSASPLVIGFGDGEMLCGSDIPALLGHTRNVAFLEDGEMAELQADSVRIETIAGVPVDRVPTRIDWSPVQAEKDGFKHFMLKEIFEQPRAVEDTLRGRVSLDRGDVTEALLRIDAADARAIERVVLVACGTSYHSALVGHSYIEQLSRIPAHAELASEVRYRSHTLGPKDLVIAISQSGETADTLAAVRSARESGARVLAVSNVLDSAIPRSSHGAFYTRAGPEVGVASTKCFTTQLVAMLLVAIQLGRLRGTLDAESARSLLQALLEAPNRMRETLESKDAVLGIAKQWYAAAHMLFLGRGLGYPVALEGALKLKEISYAHAEGYAAGEMKHGPIALIDDQMPVVVVALRNSHYEKTLSNVEEVRARDGRVIALITAGDRHMKNVAESVLELPDMPELVQPIAAVLPLQLLAYYIADLKGTDVDQPRNLAKTVTVE